MGVDPPAGVHVEVLLLRLVGTTDGRPALASRTVRAPLDDGAPDEVARRLATRPAADGRSVPRADGQAGPEGELELLHSTSWRFEPGNGVVLTYAALPDPDPAAPAVALLHPAVVSSGDPVRPQPDLLHPHHVVAHAVRHLVELAGRDPAVAAAAALPWRRRTWQVMAEEAARMPTGTHAAAHAAAAAAVDRAEEVRARP